MNEITKVHLGRQAFTISVDAHHELKNYLDAIKKQVSDKSVVEEVELRMAELLNEHGITDNKVVLHNDVDFLKAQLGNPNDFKDEDDEAPVQEIQHFKTKRLFRDTSNGMIAGVAAGLAQYFGLDALLVRILFIIAVLGTFGWGILIYIVLWVLVPEAKTSSDRLQMVGKPVNVDSLKEIVENADFKGAANRAHASLAEPINSIFRILIKLVGLFFIFTGLSMIFGLIATAAYALFNRSSWMQNNIFPIGIREHILLYIAGIVAAIVAFFIIVFGISMFRRKWPIRTWVTGILVGLVFLGMAVGGALAGNVYPNVHNRYLANTHSTTRMLSPFSSVNIIGDQANISYQYSSTYSLYLSYYDQPNLNQVKTFVSNNSLTIDISQYNPHRNCQTICIPNNYNLSITIYAPNAQQLSNENPIPPTQIPFDQFKYMH